MATLCCDSLAWKLSALRTRPEVSEGGLHLTGLIEEVSSEETDRHRQVEVSIFIHRKVFPL